MSDLIRPTDEQIVRLFRIVRTWQNEQTKAERMYAYDLDAERQRVLAPFLALATELDDEKNIAFWSPLLAERIRTLAEGTT